MMQTNAVRRFFRRFVRLDCEVVREHDFRIVGNLALDLSPKGMLVRATRPVLTGEELVVAFRPPHSNRWFDALATVARVVHGRRATDGGLCLGIEFSGVEPAQERMLFEQLRGLAPVEPARSRRRLLLSRAASNARQETFFGL